MKKDVGDANSFKSQNHDMVTPTPNLNGVFGGTRRTRESITMKFTQLARACLEFERNAKSLGTFI